MSAFELLESNPDPTVSDAQYLGVASDYQVQVASGGTLADSTIYFGVAFQQSWSSPAPLAGDIYIDVNGDGVPDYDLYVADYSNYSGNSLYDDVFVAELCNVSTSNCTLMPMNGITPDVLDTVPMDTNVIVLPVAASDLGLTSGNSRFSFYFNRESGTQVTHTFDPANAGLSFGGPFAVAGSGQPIFPDLPGQLIQVSYNQAAYTTDGAAGILLLHHHNGAGNHAEVLTTEFGSCSVSATATVPASTNPGESVTFQVTSSAPSCTGDASYLWDFGDGSAGSSLQNPTHAYTQEGTYAWTVVVSYGSFSVTRTGSIAVTRPTYVLRRHLIPAG